VSADRAELDIVLSEAQAVLGISMPGWDEPHGAPYSAFSFLRGDDIYMLVATFEDNDGMGAAIALGEEASTAGAPERIEADGHTISVHQAINGDDFVHAAVVDDVCGRYDVWAVAAIEDPSPLIADLVLVASGIDCP
jgi:hypothetical protein